MKRKERDAIKLGSEASRLSGPEGVAGRKTKGFVNVSVAAQTLLNEIRKKRRGE